MFHRRISSKQSTAMQRFDVQVRKDYRKDIFSNDERACTDHLVMTRTMLSIGGMWPIGANKASYVKNVVVSLAFMIHLPLVCLYLHDHWGDYDKMRRCLLHMRAVLLALPIQFLIRYHPKIKRLIEIMEECNYERNFRSKEEKAVYDMEMRKGKSLQLVIAVPAECVLSLIILQPMFDIPAAIRDPGNVTKHIDPMFPVFVTPIRNNEYLYFSCYAVQITIWFLIVCLPIANTFVMHSLMHVASQCLVLSYQFRNIGSQSDDFRKDIGRMVEQHIHTKWFTQCLADVLGLFVLFELFTSMTGLAVTLHRLITSGNGLNGPVNLIFFIFYFGAILGLIYAYNYSAQCILNACGDFRESMYQCEWYKMPMKVQLSILICMANAEKSIVFKVCGFYQFSYESLTTFMKTTLGYVSALGTLV